MRRRLPSLCSYRYAREHTCLHILLKCNCNKNKLYYKYIQEHQLRLRRNSVRIIEKGAIICAGRTCYIKYVQQLRNRSPIYSVRCFIA